MAYRTQNPFEEEEDDKFEELSEHEKEIAKMRQERDFYQQRMVDSTYRSLQLVQESQNIASETGGELKKQREQLERTNKNLDKMSGDLQQTDRNITSLKSIWGTVSTWFKQPLKSQSAQSGVNNSSTSDKDDFLQIHAGIQSNDRGMKDNLKSINQKTNLSWENGNDFGRLTGTSNDIVDQNLDNISAGLNILKQQGLALGKEIDEHNELLVTIQGKVDVNDVKIERQTKQINRIIR